MHHDLCAFCQKDSLHYFNLFSLASLVYIKKHNSRIRTLALHQTKNKPKAAAIMREETKLTSIVLMPIATQA